jgi:hypothetical protein
MDSPSPEKAATPPKPGQSKMDIRLPLRRKEQDTGIDWFLKLKSADFNQQNQRFYAGPMSDCRLCSMDCK